MAKDTAKEVKISALLKEKLISLNLKSSDKKGLIEELVALAGQSSKLKNKKAFARSLIERESLGSTGIGNGVAIPHAKTKFVKGFILAFGRHEAGIDFGALDGEKSHLFFVLASPVEEVGHHLKALAEISRLVKDKFLVRLLRKVKDKKETLKIIAEAEKHISQK